MRIRVIAIALVLFGTGNAAFAQAAVTRIDDALQNIAVLERPGRVGYATFWEGNKYIQCRRLIERSVRCEAAGTAMQPSLRNVLTNERLSRLDALGWTLDQSFGNYAQIFSETMPASDIAKQIVQTFAEVYGADIARLDVQTAWVANVPCPPRNGPSQNLAGLVNDSPTMRATAITSCAYTAAKIPEAVASSAELIALNGTRVTAEIQRLRINAARKVYAVFNAGIGYVQCAPDAATSSIYCEAQSAESWPALTAVLTPERLSRLRLAGYSDPGRGPNYWKSYPIVAFNDAAIAEDILTVLHEVYGYTGAVSLRVSTE